MNDADIFSLAPAPAKTAEKKDDKPAKPTR
jgi:hypothetical protein